MTAWKRLNIDESALPPDVSPFVVPSEWRLKLLGETSLAVEFRYPDGEEPADTRPVYAGVRLTIGRRSGRVFQVRVDVEELLRAFTNGTSLKDVSVPLDDVVFQKPAPKGVPEYNFASVRLGTQEALKSVPT